MNGVHLDFSGGTVTNHGVVDENACSCSSSDEGGVTTQESDLENDGNFDHELLNLMEDALYDFDFNEDDVDILLED
jgi:hypothetical protein